jgi:hypothetical protein
MDKNIISMIVGEGACKHPKFEATITIGERKLRDAPWYWYINEKNIRIIVKCQNCEFISYDSKGS